MHNEKEEAPRNPTDAGRQSDSNDSQEETAYSSMRVSFDPDSNANDESERHDLKQDGPRNSTDAGRQINSNDSQDESAYSSIRFSFEPGSNVNKQSEEEEEKLYGLRISMSRFNETVESEPKYRITEMPSKSRRKLPETRNC
jgi:hypothetical protein